MPGGAGEVNKHSRGIRKKISPSSTVPDALSLETTLYTFPFIQ